MHFMFLNYVFCFVIHTFNCRSLSIMKWFVFEFFFYLFFKYVSYFKKGGIKESWFCGLCLLQRLEMPQFKCTQLSNVCTMCALTYVQLLELTLVMKQIHENFHRTMLKQHSRPNCASLLNTVHIPVSDQYLAIYSLRLKKLKSIKLTRDWKYFLV